VIAHSSGASASIAPTRAERPPEAARGEAFPTWPPLPFDVMNFGNTDSNGSSSALLLFALMLAFVVLALPALGPQLPLRSPRLRAASLLRRLERPG
jgi:hypothetical protein